MKKEMMYRHGDLLICRVGQVKGKHVKGNILEDGLDKFDFLEEI